MKKIIKKIIYITMIAVFTTACDTDETVYNALIYPEDSFVSIDGGDVTVLESDEEPIVIQVNYSNTVAGSSSEVTVNFSITSDTAIEGVHYTIEDNRTSLNYPVGDFVDTIIIHLIDNDEEDGNKVLTFTLDDANASLGYPGPTPSGTSIDINITDNDCAFTFDDLNNISWIGNDNASGGEGPNSTQIVTYFDGTNLLMEGISYGWLSGSYWNEVVVAEVPVIVDMDPITGVFTVDFQYLCDTTWLGNPQPTYSIEASGQYFSCTNVMVVNYDLYQGGSILRSYTETIEF